MFYSTLTTSLRAENPGTGGQVRPGSAAAKLPLLACAVFLLAALPAAVTAQQAEAVTRADPLSFWEHAGNPAAQAFSGDAFSLAFREDVDLSSPGEQGDDPLENLDIGLGLGGLLYASLHGPDARTNLLTSAAAVDSFGAGFSAYWQEGDKLTGSDSRYDLGILYRPNNLVSFGLTLEDFSSSSPTWGAGLALRPLAFRPGLETILTLSADATLRDGAAGLQSLSARLMLDSWLGLKAWVEPDSLRVGLRALMRLGIGESELVLPDAQARDRVSFASALRVDLPGRRTALPFGRQLLVVDDPGFLSPTPPRPHLPAFGNEIWLGALVDAIDRAAEDPRIEGLVFYYPPQTASVADAQALRRSLSAFKAQGKPVFVYARTLGRNDYIHIAAMADHLALDPNGQLALVDLGSFNLYFRGLFEKLGIRMYNLQSHDTKTAYNSFSEYGITEAERTMKERYVGGLADQAYAALDGARAGRLTQTAAELIRTGPYLIPGRALDAGLVDALVYRDEFDTSIEDRMGRVFRLDLKDYLATTGISWGPAVGTKTVALLHLQGNIINAEGVAGRSIGEDTARLLASLRDDSAVDGILLRVDSGGGSAMMSDLIAREVRLTVKAGKPVYVSMGGYAASGGYYLAAPATRIYAEEGTITGSIGVTGLWPDASGLLEKLAIGSASVNAGDSASFGNLFLPRREEDAELLKQYIHHVYERFIDVVAQGRSMDRGRVDELGRGQVWLGSEALANGLVDEIGGLEAAKAGISAELGKPVRLVSLLPGQDPVSLMAGMAGSSRLPEARRKASGESVLPLAVTRTLELAAELEDLGSGPLTLFTDYLFRERADF